MNRLTQALAEVCREHVLDEKWLVAPARREYDQWRETIARAGTPVANLQPMSLPKMALHLAGPAMAARGATLASKVWCEALVDAACRTLARDDGYLLSGDPDPGLARALAAAVRELRLGDLSPGDLAEKRFEVPEKGRELAAILAAYVEALAQHGLVDYADVCRIAAERVVADPGVLPIGLLVLVPADVELRPVEQALLDAIPARMRIGLPVDEPVDQPVGRPVKEPGAELPGEGGLTDAALLRWIDSPTDAPEPRGDGTARVFRAEGEVNEVREVLRRCLAEGVPLDHVELLHTDRKTYVPLVYETLVRSHETSARTARADAGGLDGLPVTFAEGIPARYTPPGRALAAWVSWVRDGHPQSTLVRMFRAGLLDASSAEGGEIDPCKLASHFRSVSVGAGCERYLPKLDEKIVATELASHRRPRSLTDDPEEEEARRLERARERTTALRALRDLIAGVLDVTPDLRAPEADILRAGKEFLERFAGANGELDNYARKKLVEEIDEVLAIVDRGLGWSGVGPWEWLAALPNETPLAGSRPRPGCLHVAPVLGGGHSGRPHTFIVGLDDARFPGAGLQDPILLDGERERFAGGKLRTAAGRLAQRMADFSRALARLRGRVTLSYSCRSLVDDREAFASPVLVSAYRILSGEPGGDQAGLEGWAGRPVSFAPDGEDLSLDEAEWWLWRGCAGERIEEAGALVNECHPNLKRGTEAARHRERLEFTVYDGRVPEAAADARLNPLLPDGPVVSASRLETAGRCPRAYFFRYALRIEPPEDPGADPDEWLDGLARGSLLHEVFRDFMAELVAAGEKPVYARHAARLAEVLDRHVARQRDEAPPPSESVFRRECADLREAARTFLAEEEVLCRTSSPAFLEAAIGLPPDGEGTDLDTREPVAIALGGGRTVRVRGRLDRIDRIEDPPPPGGECGGELFAIWDYKTGSTFRYRDADPFRQGRNVQHAVYLGIAEAALREKVSPAASVALFGYFFPGPRGQGERRTYSPQQLARGHEVIASLCDTVAGGAFVATDRADDCAYCDYAPVCGQTDAEAANSRLKLEHEANSVLSPFRRLRSGGEGGADG
jgi:ATP-dependent helicase/nuclease subunit B